MLNDKIMNSAPSENILKLRELTKELCERDAKYDEIPVSFIKNLKTIIADNKKELKGIKDANIKLKVYEAMCSRLIEFIENKQ